jgi:hypothetical protein
MEIESKDPVSKGRILIVYDVSYPSIPGGGQRRLYEVGQRLAAYGFDVDWVCFDTWTPEVIAAGHSINYIGLPGYKGLYSKNGGRRYLEPVEFLVALSRASLDLSRYDVVWSGQWPIGHLRKI